jgi:hypothetical protein
MRWGRNSTKAPERRDTMHPEKELDLEEGLESFHVMLPVCEKCWLGSYTTWEPESMDRDGNILMKLKDVKVPKKINTEKPDICSECGEITVSGIYDMRDPSLAMFLDEFELENDQEPER